MQIQNKLATIGATENTQTVSRFDLSKNNDDKSLIKRMKKTVVKPIGRTLSSFGSLRFMSSEKTK